MTRKDWLLLFALSVPWGCSFLFFKVLGAELPPLTIALGRVAIAAAVLGAALAAAGVSVAPFTRHWRDMLLLGLLNNAVPFSLFAWGETLVSSGTASVFNAMAPVLTVLALRAAGLSGPFTWNKWVGVLLGFAGVVVLAGPDALVGSNLWGGPGVPGRSWVLRPGGTGDGPAAAPAAVGSCGRAVDIQHAHPRAGGGARGPALGVAGTIAEGLGGAGGAGAAVSTALAYAVYFRLVARAGPANAMLVTYMVPLTALALGNLVLREPITLNALLGAGVILAGLALLDGRWLPQREAT